MENDRVHAAAGPDGVAVEEPHDLGVIRDGKGAEREGGRCARVDRVAVATVDGNRDRGRALGHANGEGLDVFISGNVDDADGERGRAKGGRREADREEFAVDLVRLTVDFNGVDPSLGRAVDPNEEVAGVRSQREDLERWRSGEEGYTDLWRWNYLRTIEG